MSSSRFISLALVLIALLAGRALADTTSTRLINLSARGLVGTGDNVLIGGLVIPSGSAKSVLIRAVGPTLADYGVSSPLANPQIAVVDASGTTVASNDDWASSLSSTFTLLGAFALTSSSKDAALVATLHAGTYTVVATGVNDTSGVALLEIYETDTTNALSNLSSRGQVGSGDNVLIAGFVVDAGSPPRRLLLRGVGPRLADYGVTAAVSDPTITLYSSAGTALATNDNWSTPVTANDASASTLATAFADAGAFTLASGSKDSALLVTLGAGAYSMVVSGVNNATGIGLAEIYDVTSATDLPTQTAPVITSQPSSVSITSGSAASFSVSASGTAPLTYQWYKDSSAISGATSSTYSLSSATSSDAGSYTVAVANALGSVTSNAATLGVTTTTTASSALTSAAVTAAQAFLATLSTSQQSTAQVAWSLTTARHWSNLPAAMVSRNGVALSALSTAQKTAASTLISTALSSAGYSLWQGLLAADDYLYANGGGSTYGEGNYYVAILGTPSTSGFWLLQFTGHHLTYNIAFNGTYKTGTPLFLGVEPKGSFTQSGTTYDPMSAQRTAVADVLATLANYSGAQLSGTYSDLLFGANGSGGIDSTYPKSYPTGTSGRGVLYTALSASDQAKVQAAVKAYVNTQASEYATDILSSYLSSDALAATYIAYAGTAGVTTKNSYFRIDGPRVWIEFSVQNGVIFSSDIHYHTIWRDKSGDYGGNF